MAALPLLFVALGCCLQEREAVEPRAPARGLAVRVVDERGAPVAGAWVARVDGGLLSHDRWLTHVGEWLDGGALERPGYLAWVATDATGTARLALPRRGSEVVAVTAAGGARGWVDDERDVVELRLRDHRYWNVELVEPDGAAPPIGLRVRFARDQVGSLREGFTDSTVATIVARDADSIARFGPIDLVFDPEDGDPSLMAEVDLPCLVPPRLRARCSAIGAAPMALELLPHGTLEVRVVDEAGAPVTRAVKLSIESNEFSQLGLPGPYSGMWSRVVVARDGSARVTPIGVGLEMRVAVIPSDDAPARTRRLTGDGVVPGPSRAGEVVSTVVVADANRPGTGIVEVQGRAVDSGGHPLSRRSLEIVVVGSKSGRELAIPAERWRWMESGADGSFRGDLELLHPFTADATGLLLDRGPVGASDQHEAAWSPFDPSLVADVASAAARELGTVTLQPLPLLVAGRVVPGGVAYDDPYVTLHCVEEAPDPEIPPWWWRRLDRSARSLAPDGRFEIRGFAGAREWWLEAGSWQMIERRHDFKPGTIHLEITRGAEREEVASKPATATISGRVLLDEGVPVSVVVVELVALDGVAVSPALGLAATLFGGPWAGTSRFVREELAPGRFDVRVVLQEFGQERTELARIPAVELRAGATTKLPPIDLRGRIQVARVRLVDRSGAPVPFGHVLSRVRSPWPRAEGGSALAVDPDHQWFRFGEFMTCTATDWAPLEFLAFGCRRVVHRFEAGGETTLVLPPPARVVIHLPPGLPSLRHPLTLDVTARAPELATNVMFIHGGSWPTSDTQSARPDGTVELHLPAAGRYVLDVTVVELPVGGGWRGATVVRDIDLDVPDRDEPLEIELLEVTPEAVAQAARLFD